MSNIWSVFAPPSPSPLIESPVRRKSRQGRAFRPAAVCRFKKILERWEVRVAFSIAVVPMRASSQRKPRTRSCRSCVRSGVAFDSVPDLCEMSARKDAALKRLADGGNLKIAACYPRAVRWLFSAAQAPLEGGSYQVLNMRTESPDDVVSSLLDPASPGEEESGS